jgi:hypothetical protein
MRTIGRAAALMLATLALAAPAAAATPAVATTPIAATRHTGPAKAAASAKAAGPAKPAAPATTAAASTVVYGFGKSAFGPLHAAVMPDRISFGTDGTHFITGLTWSMWQPASARATGRYHIDDCVPTCAAGTYHVYPVTMQLSHVVTRHGHSYFAGMTLRWRQSRAKMSQALTWGTHGGNLAFWG